MKKTSLLRLPQQVTAPKIKLLALLAAIGLAGTARAQVNGITSQSIPNTPFYRIGINDTSANMNRLTHPFMVFGEPNTQLVASFENPFAPSKIRLVGNGGSSIVYKSNDTAYFSLSSMAKGRFGFYPSDNTSASLIIDNKKVGIGTNNPTADLEVSNLDSQANITDGAFSYGSEQSSLKLIKRAGPYTDGFGRPAALIDLRASNGTDSWSTAQILGVAGSAGGSDYCGGLALMTSQGRKQRPGITVVGDAPVTRMMITAEGNVGIGTTTPQAPLHVNGEALMSNDASGGDPVPVAKIVDNEGSDGNKWFLGFNNATDGDDSYDLVRLQTENNQQRGVFSIQTSDGTAMSERLRIDTAGYVGIGTSNITEMLTVGGGVKCNQLITDASEFPDYVFQDSYKLKSLNEVQDFIKTNKHLPGMPAEQEVVSKGLNVAKVSVASVEKIEELYLYLIQLNEKVKQLEAELKAAKAAQAAKN